MKRLLHVIVAIMPWIGLGLFVAWLILLRFPVNGVTHFRFAFDGRTPWMNTFLPGERVTQPGPQTDGWVGQRVFGDPVYANARIPGVFDEVEVAFEARFLHQPFLEMGYSTQGTTSYEFKPLWSEALSKGWRHVTMGRVSGFVREDLPDKTLLDAPTDRVLVWRATPPTDQFMDAPVQEKFYERSLRGAHDFYFVPTDGQIYLKLLLQDVNRSRAGGNVVAFRLTKDEDVLWTDAISTSGNQDHHPGDVYEKIIQIHDLSPGVYHLAIIADDDIFIRRFSTKAKRWVIGPRLYFGDTSGYATSTLPATAWTNSSHLTLETRHEEGLQTVTLGTASVQIPRTHEVFSLDRASNQLTGDLLLQAPRGDIRFLGDAYFSFDPSALFLPSPRRLTDNTDLQKEGIYAVITPYQKPDELGEGWKRLHLRFPIEDARDRLFFVLSAPGILLRQGAVDIRSAEFTYRRAPMAQGEWWVYLKRELANAWRRL